MNQHDGPSCRICFESQVGLIAPCRCKGTVKYIHRECLDTWRASHTTADCFTHCPQCKFEYVIEPYDPNSDKRRKIIYYLYITRDLFLFFLVNEIMVLFLAFVSEKLDMSNGSQFLNYFPLSIQAHSFAVYHLFGFLIYLAIIGFVGSIVFLISGSARNMTCNCVYCGDCCCYECGCNDCACGDCGDCGKVDEPGACLACIIITVIIFAVIGIFIGIATFSSFIAERMVHHKNKLWKYQETQKFIVKDLQNINIDIV